MKHLLCAVAALALPMLMACEQPIANDAAGSDEALTLPGASFAIGCSQAINIGSASAATAQSRCFMTRLPLWISARRGRMRNARISPRVAVRNLLAAANTC